MCSIAGVIHPAEMQEAIRAAEAMNQAQFHRGPDGGGLWHDDVAVLAHRRLSIIDLAGGAQPMSNEDGTIHLVFNGEIYNHIALRAQLKQSGHIFKTGCDTEVLLHLYEETGDFFVRELDGMFAFALWDAPRGKLLLGRDRAGKKPLHYFLRKNTLVFASEIAALRKHPDFPAELSGQAVADFLSLQYVPSPRTVYREVFKVPPGSVLRYFPETGRAAAEKYWDLSFLPKQRISFAEARGQLRYLVTQAVRKRLMSDVPFGVFLSGGVDSGIIASTMAQLRAPEITRAYSIGFEDPVYDERSLARISADFINLQTKGALQLHEKVLPEIPFRDFCRWFGNFGEPYCDTSYLPTGALCAFAREEVTMALSGDGADELFGGYERYQAMKLAKKCRLIPPPLRRWLFHGILQRCLADGGERTFSGRLRRLSRMLGEDSRRQYFRILDRCPEEAAADLFGERLKTFEDTAKVFHIRHTARAIAEKCMEIDFHLYLPGDILPKVDRASMASSLEVRCPFLDRDVVEFAATLPSAFKMRHDERKFILREAFADALAPEVFSGRKRGFGVPVSRFLRTTWAGEVPDVLFAERLFRGGWVTRRGVEKLWEDHLAGRGDHSYLICSLLVLSLFLEKERLY